MAGVVIGVDPAKRSHTIEVIDGRERVLVAERFENTNTGYRAMRGSGPAVADPGVGGGGCDRC